MPPPAPVPPPDQGCCLLTQRLRAEGDAVQDADAAGRGRRDGGAGVAGGLHCPRHLPRCRRAAVARHPPHHHARPQPRRLPRQRARRHLGHSRRRRSRALLRSNDAPGSPAFTRPVPVRCRRCSALACLASVAERRGPAAAAEIEPPRRRCSGGCLCQPPMVHTA